ncbi:MAG: hypothetical protein Q8M16_08810 [Pirellulaceae bacterium]|nr:hypothetical protein [Pirellulaceae bacterium]
MKTTFKTTHVFLRLVALSAIAVVTGWNTKAHAQVAASEWNGPGSYTYDIHSMPDLDQRRSGLDNNGNMHCVPTATMNLLAFCANFGVEDMPPYPGVWMGAPVHGEMTGWIEWLGLYMGTTGEDGTSGNGLVNGLSNWIEDSGSPILTESKFRNGEYWPTIDDATLYATNGSIIQFAYGRYDWQYGTQGPPELVLRDGGHAVTLKLAFANNGNERGNRLIHYRDPATDDGNLASNSNFSSVWPATARNMNIGIDVDGDGLADFFTMTALNYPVPQDGQYQILDSFTAVFPPGGVTVDGNTVSGIFRGGKLGFVQDQVPTPYSPPSGRNVISAIPHPDQHSTLFLESAGRGQVDLVRVSHTGQRHPLMTTNSQSHLLTLGFGHEVYLAADREVFVINLIGDRAVGGAVHVGTAPARVNGLCFDSKTDSLLVTYGQNARILPRDSSRWIDLGPNAGLRREKGPFRNVSIAHGNVYATLASGTVVAASYPNQPVAGRPLVFSAVELRGVKNAKHVDSDGMNRLYVSDSVNGLMEFEMTESGKWRTAEKEWFPTIGPKSRFVPFRNRTNVRPGDLDASQWYNIDPSELLPLGPEIDD